MDILKLHRFLQEGNLDIFATEDMVDEMAMIVGDLDNAIRDVIEANPDLDGIDLKRKIRGDEGVKNALGSEKLHDNQLNRFIAKVKGGAPRAASSETPKSAKPEGSEEPGEAEEPEATAFVPRARKEASGLTSSQEESIISKAQHGAAPEELAAEYDVPVNVIQSVLSADQEKEGEEDVEKMDVAGLGEPDEERPPLELEIPDQSNRNVDNEVYNKAERMFYFNPKQDKENILSSVKAWADKRNEKVDFTKPQHPLRGASEEQVQNALDKLKVNLGKAKIAASKRREAGVLKGLEGEPGERTDNPREMEKQMGIEFDSFQNFSKTLSEHMKTLRTTSVTRYPNQITFSEEFLNKLAEEYLNHCTIAEDRGIIRNLEEKMIKALRMHIHEMSKKKAIPCKKCGKTPCQCSEKVMKESDKHDVDNTEVINQVAHETGYPRLNLLKVWGSSAHLSKMNTDAALKYLTQWVKSKQGK